MSRALELPRGLSRRSPTAPFARAWRVRLARAGDGPRAAIAFAAVAVRYLALVLPEVRRERSRWRAFAETIPSDELRATASASLTKRGNIEGAALFSVLAPRAHRREAIRSLVAFQAAYNYLDALSELSSPEPQANARRLHQALLGAVQPGAAQPDYYAYHRDACDGGYLAALVEACRDGLSRLPSYDAFAPAISTAAARIAEFQALNLSEVHGGQAELELWAATLPGSARALAWWERAAGAGSSLALLVLVATCARENAEASVAQQIDDAYFPTIGALHSLLDSVVDRDEDREKGQRSLLDHYGSPLHECASLTMLASEARRACASLPSPHAHRVFVTAMCSYYLSAPQCRSEPGYATRVHLTDALGSMLDLAIVMFTTRRLLARIAGDGYT
jgi:tetraprenyl-beta-curcumene synthase